jgi:hypothetical protein
MQYKSIKLAYLIYILLFKILLCQLRVEGLAEFEFDYYDQQSIEVTHKITRDCLQS